MEVREHWQEQTLDEPSGVFEADRFGIAALDHEIDRLEADIRRVTERIAQSRRNLANLTGGPS